MAVSLRFAACLFNSPAPATTCVRLREYPYVDDCGLTCVSTQLQPDARDSGSVTKPVSHTRLPPGFGT